MAPAPFDGQRNDLALAAIDEVTAVGVIVRGAGGRIESYARLHLILPSAHDLDRRRHAARDVDRGLFVLGRKVLAIDVVVEPAALPVVYAIAEVHLWILGLILVAAPAVQDRFAVAVQIDHVADV